MDQFKVRLFTIFVVIILFVPACDINESIPDLNNPSLEELTDAPTPTSVASLATGLLIGNRSGIENYIYMTGIVGREMYDLDAATLATSELVIGPLDPGQWGGNAWTSQYQNIRNAIILLDATDQVDQFSENQKEGLRGYAKTFIALELLIVINARDINGAVINIGEDPTGEPGSLVDKNQVFDRIKNLLEEAKVHLENAGNGFPFDMPSGFTQFDNPAGFLTFNRGIKARVSIYNGEYERALNELDDSFLDPDANLDLGVYHTHSSSAGDLSNFFSTKTQGSGPDYVAQQDYETDAQLKEDGEPDERYQQKFRSLPSERSHLGLVSDITFTIYNTPSSRIPIIRNEELLLLRAEANFHLENYQDAADDLNLIRTRAGGLEERNDLNEANILDELLYNRRYSLYMEGGHRWIDSRRYERLGDLPLDIPNAVVHERFPIPSSECLAQGLSVPCSAN